LKRSRIIENILDVQADYTLESRAL